jgi:deoxyribonuclease IV
MKAVNQDYMKVGAHVSIAGGVFNAPLNAAKIGCETFQIFTRSPRGGKAPELTPEILKQFNDNLKQAKISEFVIHSPYYINLASKNPRIYHGSIEVLRDDLERGSLLGAKYLMFHIGSAKDFGTEKSLKMVIEGLNKILAGYKGSTELLIENSAGSGEIIGDSFEEISFILSALEDGPRHFAGKKIKSKSVGVCLDTCHLFASGYDLRDKKTIDELLKKFDQTIGLGKLKVFHLNDSKTPFNSKKDRHADIGFGEIGQKAFEIIINHPKLKNINAIIETPEEKLDYAKTLKLLKQLRKS